jgi:hypothetical protein
MVGVMVALSLIVWFIVGWISEKILTILGVILLTGLEKFVKNKGFAFSLGFIVGQGWIWGSWLLGAWVALAMWPEKHLVLFDCCFWGWLALKVAIMLINLFKLVFSNRKDKDGAF